MLVIQHSTGPLAGKEERIDPVLDRVVFGRTLGCQVVYPPEETIVAREHFALVRKPPGPAGHWTVELFGEPFVAINGVAADPNQALPARAIFELGKHGGPSFKLTVQPDAATDNLPRTLGQEPQERPRILAVKAGRTARLARRLAAAGVVIALAAFGAASYYAHRQSQLTISTEVRNRLAHAAFFVEWVPKPGYTNNATAWPVGPHILATNGHVAQEFPKIPPGHRMTVRSPGPNGKVYQVVDYKIHPGYTAFPAFVAQNVDRSLGLGSNYDVALLTVKEELPADSILELATDDELRELAAGSVVATAGYPSEDVTGAPVRKVAAVAPELHVGTVTSMSDFFFSATDFARNQLIHYDLPTTGGSSGSPVVNRNGHVIAVHNLGNMIHLDDGRRVPTGVIINYGQRADVLRQLISGTAERDLAEAQKYWTQQAHNLRSRMVVNTITSGLTDVRKKEVQLTLLSEETAVLSDPPVSRNNTLQRQKSHVIKVPSDVDYVLSAYSQDGSTITLWVYANDQLVGKNDQGEGWLRAVFLGPTSNTTLTAWVVSKSDKPVTYTFAVHKIQSE